MNDSDDAPDFPPPLKSPKFDPVNAAHTLIEAAEDVQWDFDDKVAFLKRVQHIELGLSAEDEFSALVAWLGRCSLVHRNGQKWQSSFADTKWHIPDLFTVFRRGATKFSAFIEVKTTERSVLRFKESYIQGLREYSAIHSQPLLIAWRPRKYGLWLLFDPAHLRLEDGKLAIDFATALMNNFLGCIAGDFSVSPIKGAGLYFFLKRVGDTTPTAEGYSATFVYDDISWKDGQQQKHEHLPRSIKYLLLSAGDMVDFVNDDSITKAWITSGGACFAQNIFRSLATGWNAEGEPTRWGHIQANRDTFLPRDELFQGIQEHFNTFVHHVIHQQPAHWPAYLPEAWKNATD